jgi:hypothetical protein
MMISLRPAAVELCFRSIAGVACRNYVVQHVLRCVPQARAALHAAFRGRYVSLSTQMASSHVVQRCLELFSPEQADEIVGELLGCHRHHWAGCTFQQLISDRFANFVLQTAMERTEVRIPPTNAYILVRVSITIH